MNKIRWEMSVNDNADPLCSPCNLQHPLRIFSFPSWMLQFHGSSSQSESQHDALPIVNKCHWEPRPAGFLTYLVRSRLILPFALLPLEFLLIPIREKAIVLVSNILSQCLPYHISASPSHKINSVKCCKNVQVKGI